PVPTVVMREPPISTLVPYTTLFRSHDIEVVDWNEPDNLGDAIRDLTGGRGADAVIDAVGMEAHGSPGTKLAQQLTGLMPDAVARSEEHTSELQSRENLVCRLLLEKK